LTSARTGNANTAAIETSAMHARFPLMVHLLIQQTSVSLNSGATRREIVPEGSKFATLPATNSISSSAAAAVLSTTNAFGTSPRLRLRPTKQTLAP
jgi:hypothetical protein